MHLTPQTLAAAASSPWIIPNPLLHSAVLGVALTFTSNANLTCSIQHTFDDPTVSPRNVSITRVGTVATINDPNHGLNVGDNVQIFSDPSGTFGPVPPGAGYPFTASASAVPVGYDIVGITDQNNYTITVPNSGSLGPVTCTLQSFRVFNADDARLVGVTGTPPGRVDGNYAAPVMAVRLKVTAYTAGSVTLTANQGLGN